MRSATILAALPLAAAIPAPAKRAPLVVPETDELIEGSYIVKLKSSEGVQTAVSSIAADADAIYSSINSFAASLTEEEVEALRDDPNVSSLTSPSERTGEVADKTK